MTGEQKLQEKQGRNWLGNTTMIVILLAILGALIYGVSVFHNGYIQDIRRGENGRAAFQMLDEMRRSFISLKQDELALLQSNDKGRAIAAIESSINVERKNLSNYIKLTDYNEELQKMAPKFVVSYEAWASLELELVNKQAAVSKDPASPAENAEPGVLEERSLSSFLSLMDVLGDSGKIIQDDIDVGEEAEHGLLLNTLIFAAYLIVLSFWWIWSNASKERRYYRNVSQLYNMGNKDSLTGLPNRLVLEDRFATAIAGARRYERWVGVLYLDIDGLSEVNVKMGYQAGDIVLKEAALRLEKNTRDMDTVARAGEDEFVVLITNLKQKTDAEVVADKLKIALSRPFELGGEQYSPRVSIGSAVYPGDGENPEQLVNHANSEMYKAKQITNLSSASIQQ